MIVSVAILSTGCSNQSSDIDKVKIVRVPIPDNLLVTCPKPNLSGHSIADIAAYSVRVTDQLKICNSRISQIREIMRKESEFNQGGSDGASKDSYGRGDRGLSGPATR